jgi:hypothetical protein
VKRKIFKIKFGDIHSLEDFLDRHKKSSDAFDVSIQPNGDVHIELFESKRLAPAPPDWGLYCLLLIPKRNREHLVGDLEEEFRTVILPRYGPRKAACWYWWNVIVSIVPFGVQLLKRILGFAVILKLIGK